MPEYRVIQDTTPLDDIVANAGQLILIQLARDTQKIARDSTVKRKGPSPRGTPPHEHYGDLDRSIEIGITADGEIVVGSQESVVGERGHVLEFAGTFDPAAGRDERGRFIRGHASRKAPSGAKWAHPFMRPAFEAALSGGSFDSNENVSSSFT